MDTISGGGGSDHIDVRGPFVSVDGGSGHDSLYIGLNVSVVDRPTDGSITDIESIYVRNGEHFDLEDQSSTVGHIYTMSGSTNADYVTFVTGTQGGDKMTGGSGLDSLNGFSGNDIINGGAGNDVLIGGSGADKVFGGLGADTFQFQAVSDFATGNAHVDKHGFDVVSGDVDGDGQADFSFIVETGAPYQLQASDFATPSQSSAHMLGAGHVDYHQPVVSPLHGGEHLAIA